MTGLDKGVKYLSSLNMGLAGLFMLFVLIAGPTAFLMSGFTQNLGFYFSELTQLSMWTETFKNSNWQGSWTVFYWAWWISWSPFVGMFIARISKGRTVKEFVIGVVLIPSLLSFMWMSVFGGSALFFELQGTGRNSCGGGEKCLHSSLCSLGEFSFHKRSFRHRDGVGHHLFCDVLRLRLLSC